jgi:L-2-hydroxycarboxylate dehydrogenase (NAD+)
MIDTNLPNQKRTQVLIAFKKAMDDYQQLLKNVPKVEGQNRIYIHGEKEYEAEERHLREGIPLNRKVAADLPALAQELQVESVL